MRYEYKVIPAPEKGQKAPGAKGAEARFAAAIERIMNELAAEGWEYLRSDTLPSEERAGLTQSQTVWRNLLVFRRPQAEVIAEPAPRQLAPPEPAPAPQPKVKPARRQRPKAPRRSTPEADEEPAPIEALPDALRARAQRLRKEGDA